MRDDELTSVEDDTVAFQNEARVTTRCGSIRATHLAIEQKFSGFLRTLNPPPPIIPFFLHIPEGGKGMIKG